MCWSLKKCYQVKHTQVVKSIYTWKRKESLFRIFKHSREWDLWECIAINKNNKKANIVEYIQLLRIFPNMRVPQFHHHRALRSSRSPRNSKSSSFKFFIYGRKELSIFIWWLFYPYVLHQVLLPPRKWM